MAGRIGMSQYSFDAPKRRKDNDASFGQTDCTWHVPRAIAQTLAKKVWPGMRAKPMY